MKSLRILPVLLLLAFAGSSAAAYAACSVDFTGSCDWGGASTADCAFSAVPDCGSASFTSFSWDFGDGGTGSGVLPSHTYSNPASAGAYDVTVTLTCSDSCTAYLTRRVCFTIGSFGCIQPDVGPN
jgi:PKD repeat protein